MKLGVVFLLPLIVLIGCKSYQFSLVTLNQSARLSPVNGFVVSVSQLGFESLQLDNQIIERDIANHLKEYGPVFVAFSDVPLDSHHDTDPTPPTPDAREQLLAQKLSQILVITPVKPQDEKASVECSLLDIANRGHIGTASATFSVRRDYPLLDMYSKFGGLSCRNLLHRLKLMPSWLKANAMWLPAIRDAKRGEIPYSPGIPFIDGYGRAGQFVPKYGGGVPLGPITPNAYGPGVHMDSTGRPVQAVPWP